MAEILTPWEQSLMDMDIDEWLDQEDCQCEGLCTCPEQEDPPG